ncbi:NADH-quinone oxidoreductase subunit L [Asanoa sp. NPDC049573]|uniref:NADH-quinone oxidoreductase subunit 5 family protein n=1 Tax=Asanoa sp. NPDC049573 TaxID=3155396 RepID=UPI00342B5E94
MSLDVLGPLLPLLPLAAALSGFVVPLRSRTAAASLGIAGAGGALVVAIVLAVRVDEPFETVVQWVQFGDLSVTAGVRIDQAASLVAVAVGVVALAVQVYSTAYLHDDDRYPPYAAQISLFTAAMLLVVVSGDLILLLVGWEVMGICSYLLIGHDRTLPGAPAAAVKAFLVTRVGDVGFLLGIVLLGVNSGSFWITQVLAGLPALPAATVTATALLLLAGVAGKSAQFPLHTWLPDAMAGPTPISALIHAATMVAAGIYVVTRLYPVFVLGEPSLVVLGVLAAITVLLGALAATAQDDIKRVLAWSTVSQIGYMAAALAVGAPAVALFHLLTHAAFKALLFLGAGSVIHAVGSNSMSAMGGLRRRMPGTFWSMTIGLGALVGLPPLAGFWSKDAVLHAASTADAGWLPWLVYSVGAVGVLVTAWYAGRLWLRTFFGAARSPGAETAHEPPWPMAVPVLALAVPSALLGLLAFSDGFGERLTLFVVDLPEVELAHLGAETAVPLAALLLGLVLVWALWRRDTALDPARFLGPLRPTFDNAFWLDTVQDRLVVRPVVALARRVAVADQQVVDGAVESTGQGTVDAGDRLAAWHRSGLPRAATALLAGVLLLGLAAALYGSAT